jgi:hypothetical protein
VFGLPRPLTLDLQPLETFAVGDLAPQPVDRLLTAMKNGTGPVTRDQALSVAAVQRGRNELCSIATLPLRLYRGLDVVPSPLFRQFDPDVPNVVHMSLTIEDLALEHVAWWEVTGQDFDGYPVAVRRIDPSRVELKNPTGKPQPDDDRWVWIRRDDRIGGWRRVPATLMIRFDSPNPGILKANARAIRIAMRLDELTEMYASNPALREYFTDADDPNVDPMDDESAWRSWPNTARCAASSRTAGSRHGQASRRVVAVAEGPHARRAARRGEPRDRERARRRPRGPGRVSTTSRTYFNGVDRRQEKVNRTYAPYMSAITDRLAMGDVTRRGYAPQVRPLGLPQARPEHGQAQYWKALKDMGVTDAKEIRGFAGLSGPPGRRSSPLRRRPPPCRAPPG